MISILAYVQDADVTEVDVCLHVDRHKTFDECSWHFIDALRLKAKALIKKIGLVASDVKSSRPKVLDDWTSTRRQRLTADCCFYCQVTDLDLHVFLLLRLSDVFDY
jgi:hypothetical protein